MFFWKTNGHQRGFRFMIVFCTAVLHVKIAERKRSPFHVLPSNGHWPNIWPISRRLGALHSSPKLIWLQLPSSSRYWFTACGLRLWWDCKRSWKLFWDKWYLTVTKYGMGGLKLPPVQFLRLPQKILVSKTKITKTPNLWGLLFFF